MRLDRYLVEMGKFDSRQKAQEAIKAGRVLLNGVVVRKASCVIPYVSIVPESTQDITLAPYTATPHITILGTTYVSRAALKLKGFLEECIRVGIVMDWKNAIDVGAARGGFSQVLLECGVGEIWCVDVGSNQLHPMLLNDTRIISFEQCDIRSFAANTTRIFDGVVCDVSFIGTKQIFDVLTRLGKEMILLFKPQFEVGREAKRSKRGVVLDSSLVHKALQEFITFVESKGFCVRMCKPSHIKGKEGNAEFFIYVCR